MVGERLLRDSVRTPLARDCATDVHALHDSPFRSITRRRAKVPRNHNEADIGLQQANGG